MVARAANAARSVCRPCGVARRAPAYAALDLGTNNCRLLVARPSASGFRVIDAFSRIVRLGEGLAAGQRFSDGAVQRTIDALRVCAAKTKRHRVEGARAVATEACRRARDGDDFVRRVHDETGFRLEIISPREEVDLIIAGCLPLLDEGRRYGLVFDIGGGSTELIWLARDGNGTGGSRVLDFVSVPRGVVDFAETYGGDRIESDAYAAMVAEFAAYLQPFEKRYGIAAKVASEDVQMLGTSGTVTTVSSVHLGLKRYDRSIVDGSHLSFAEIDDVRDRLTGMNYDQRAAMECVGPGRADLVVAGLAILDAVREVWPVGRLRVADRGLREGILMGLMGVGA